MAAKGPKLLKENEYILIFSILTLLAYVTLYVFRHLDDNRLTSWQWVFQFVDFSSLFSILMGGIVLSFIIARISLPIHAYAVFLFLVSFAAACFFWSIPEVIVDASRYFTQAKHLEIYGIRYFIEEWGRDVRPWTDLPLVSFFYGLIFTCIGEHRIFIQFFTSLLFSLSVVLTYVLGKLLWNEETGFYGGLLLLGIPYLYTQVPLMLVDVPVMFFLLLSIVTFIRAIEKRGVPSIMLASGMITLAFFSKYSTWMMLSVLIIVTLVYRPKGSSLEYKSILYRGLITALVSGAVIGAFMVYKLDVITEQIHLLFTYQKPGLRRWSESFISTFIFQIHPFITASALFSVYKAVKAKDTKYLVIFWLVFLVMILDIKRIRYIIMVFPMITLMASYGIQELDTNKIKKFTATSIVILSLITAFFAYRPFLQNISAVNLRDAGEYLDSIDVTDVEVFTLVPEYPVSDPSVFVPILDFHTVKNILYSYERKKYLLPGEKIEKSSLRFTWDYKNPEYYIERQDLRGDKAVAVISDDINRALPDGLHHKLTDYTLTEVFDTYEGIFRMRTSVSIYERKQ